MQPVGWNAVDRPKWARAETRIGASGLHARRRVTMTSPGLSHTIVRDAGAKSNDLLLPMSCGAAKSRKQRIRELS